MKTKARYAVALPFIFFTALFLYIAAWSISYRMPAEPPRILDLRVHSTDRAYYVVLCAALADNWSGFPGHCYVAWSECAPGSILSLDSVGFGPCRIADQIPSLWSRVDGTVVHGAAHRNTRNLDALILIVDAARYESTKRIAAQWSHRQFQTGVSDCVGLVDDIATSLKINTPPCEYKFPQDYIKEIKALNHSATFQSVAYRGLLAGSQPAR